MSTQSDRIDLLLLNYYLFFMYNYTDVVIFMFIGSETLASVLPCTKVLNLWDVLRRLWYGDSIRGTTEAFWTGIRW
jgi:hypothetical protein